MGTSWKRWACIASICLTSLCANAVTPMIVAGEDNSSLFLNSDGSVWGTGNVANYWPGATSPVQILQLSNVISVATGGWANYALLADGTLWGLGNNGEHQLADGTTQGRSEPQRIPGLRDVKAFTVAGWHRLALKNDGTVWAWGWNDSGQLGDGTQIDRDIPVQVSGLTNVTRIAGHGRTSLALKSDGTVWVWGNTCCGQAGNGSFPLNMADPEWTHPIPTQVLNLDRVVAIAAGNKALRDDGTVWTWGAGEIGQNGTGRLMTELLPVQVPGLQQVIAIGASSTSSFAVKADGTVWAWGSNSQGLLGVSGISYSAVPLQVPGLSDIAAISVGENHILAMQRDGTVLAWGRNDYGQLGDGMLQDRSDARPVTGLGGSGQLNLLQPAPTVFNQLPQAQISFDVGSGRAPLTVTASARNASDPDGTIAAYHWKSGNGQQASGSTATFTFTLAGTYQIDLLIEDNLGARGHTAQSIVVAPAAAAAVAVSPKVGMGQWGSIALTNDGRILTWGGWGIIGAYGSLQYGESNSVPIANGVAGAVDIAIGYHVHALMADGTVLGWGENPLGEVGSGSTAGSVNQPELLPDLPPVQALAAGERYGLALTRDGRVFAWGDNTAGQLGLGDYQNRFRPAEVPGLNNVTAIAAGKGFSVALKTDGTVWGWGGGAANSPAQIPGLTNIKKIFATDTAVIAMDANGAAWVTGGFAFPFPSDPGGGPGARRFPAFDGFVKFAGGTGWGRFIIALKADGTVWTGGLQTSLALGHATSGDIAGLRQLLEISDAIDVAGGGNGAMALRGDGTVLAWGLNTQGQLGDGTLAQRLTPVAVVNETGDGFLDLIPGTDFELPPSVGVPFFVVAAGDVSSTNASVSTTTKFNARDVGKNGEVYVTATVPAGSLVPAASPMSAAGASGSSAATETSSFVLVNLTSSGQWQPVTNGQVLPYASGVLGDQLSAQTILDNTDTTNLKGAQFCLGYGLSAAQMIASGTMRVVASIPDPNATGVTAPTCILAGPPVSYSLALPQGWSLLGNSLNQALAVSTFFNDANAITSVWKWDANTFGWQFYTPLMTATELQTYAASKGYAVLATINPGEGYWVNAKSPPTIGAQSGDSFILTGMHLAKGWNLVATGNDIAPTEFNANLRASAVPASLKTLWAWDNPSEKWFFYAPSLEAQGGTALSGYIANKGYLDFATTNKKLGNGTGFWVNR